MPNRDEWVGFTRRESVWVGRGRNGEAKRDDAGEVEVEVEMETASLIWPAGGGGLKASAQ